ncbi:MAG: hypothetical protein U9N76_04080 [Candidatus Marinimicrobia bacterium]|nr:hypothetical protein [Candidatus Neomarinimicrobiota bacterium]
MKKLFLTIIIICITISLNAQIQYSITDFKPKDIKESQLYFKLGSGYNINNYNYKDLSDTLSYTEYNRTNKSNNSFFNSILRWELKKETAKKIFFSNTELILNGNINNSTRQIKRFSDENNYLITSDDNHIENKKYMNFKTLNNFNYYLTNNFGISNDLSFDTKFDNKKREATQLNNSTIDYDSLLVAGEMVDIFVRNEKYDRNGIRNDKHNSINFNYFVGPIFGRLYEGKYSALAMELIDELRKDKLLKTKPTNSQIKKLAKIIYEEKNRYYQDSRMKRKRQLKEIISFLINNNLIEDSVMPILTINDIYNYSSANYSTDDVINGTMINNGLINYNRPFGFYGGIKIGGGYSEKNDFYESIYPEYNRIITFYDSTMTVVQIDTSIRDKYERIDVRTDGNYNYSLNGFLSYGKPFGWHFHFVSNLSLNYTKYDTLQLELLTYDDSEDYDSTITPNRQRDNRLTGRYGGSFYTQLQYFMNSRTVFQLYQKTEIWNKQYKFDEKFDYDYYDISTTIGLTGEYYFTPSFHLYFNTRYTLDNIIDKERYYYDWSTNEGGLLSVESNDRNNFYISLGSYLYF